ncbi:GTP pyrophosphokinase [Paenibacillus sp. FSL K6-2524]|uniref:GTP pyrophosphokinase n=1 Tax=Paenibacillus sp. FSL K6-2524 TaxID=2954516 RepID=UPI0030FC90BD
MNPLQIEKIKGMRTEITRFMMMYKFAINEIETKIDILKDEFHFLHDYNPIENSKSRVKSFESIMKKLYRKGGEPSLTYIRENIRDIAGIRITCSFVSDIYRISDMLSNQSDLTIVEVKDYIKNPKPNGYKSLHVLAKVPIFMSDRQEEVYVEIQIRTMAMDFWASLEHKIYYKFNQEVPLSFLEELKEAADSAASLDQKMERLHHEINAIKVEKSEEGDILKEINQLLVNNQQISIPKQLLELLNVEQK